MGGGSHPTVFHPLPDPTALLPTCLRHRLAPGESQVQQRKALDKTVPRQAFLTQMGLWNSEEEPASLLVDFPPNSTHYQLCLSKMSCKRIPVAFKLNNKGPGMTIIPAQLSEHLSWYQ